MVSVRVGPALGLGFGVSVNSTLGLVLGLVLVRVRVRVSVRVRVQWAPATPKKKSRVLMSVLKARLLEAVTSLSHLGSRSFSEEGPSGPSVGPL